MMRAEHPCAVVPPQRAPAIVAVGSQCSTSRAKRSAATVTPRPLPESRGNPAGRGSLYADPSVRHGSPLTHQSFHHANVRHTRALNGTESEPSHESSGGSDRIRQTHATPISGAHVAPACGRGLKDSAAEKSKIHQPESVLTGKTLHPRKNAEGDNRKVHGVATSPALSRHEARMEADELWSFGPLDRRMSARTSQRGSPAADAARTRETAALEGSSATRVADRRVPTKNPPSGTPVADAERPFHDQHVRLPHATTNLVKTEAIAADTVSIRATVAAGVSPTVRALSLGPRSPRAETPPASPSQFRFGACATGCGLIACPPTGGPSQNGAVFRKHYCDSAQAGSSNNDYRRLESSGIERRKGAETYPSAATQGQGLRTYARDLRLSDSATEDADPGAGSLEGADCRLSRHNNAERDLMTLARSKDAKTRAPVKAESGDWTALKGSIPTLGRRLASESDGRPSGAAVPADDNSIFRNGTGSGDAEGSRVRSSSAVHVRLPLRCGCHQPCVGECDRRRPSHGDNGCTARGESCVGMKGATREIARPLRGEDKWDGPMPASEARGPCGIHNGRLGFTAPISKHEVAFRSGESAEEVETANAKAKAPISTVRPVIPGVLPGALIDDVGVPANNVFDDPNSATEECPVETTVRESGEVVFSFKRSGCLRRGKWSRLEEEFAKKIINDFDDGMLDASAGVGLRQLLASKLHCEVMRVSKKFSGWASVGKRSFRPVRSEDGRATRAQANLYALEQRWLKTLVPNLRTASKQSISDPTSGATNPSPDSLTQLGSPPPDTERSGSRSGLQPAAKSARMLLDSASRAFARESSAKTMESLMMEGRRPVSDGCRLSLGEPGERDARKDCARTLTGLAQECSPPLPRIHSAGPQGVDQIARAGLQPLERTSRDERPGPPWWVPAAPGARTAQEIEAETRQRPSIERHGGGRHGQSPRVEEQTTSDGAGQVGGGPTSGGGSPSCSPRGRPWAYGSVRDAENERDSGHHSGRSYGNPASGSHGRSWPGPSARQELKADPGVGNNQAGAGSLSNGRGWHGHQVSERRTDDGNVSTSGSVYPTYSTRNSSREGPRVEEGQRSAASDPEGRSDEKADWKYQSPVAEQDRDQAHTPGNLRPSSPRNISRPNGAAATKLVVHDGAWTEQRSHTWPPGRKRLKTTADGGGDDAQTRRNSGSTSSTSSTSAGNGPPQAASRYAEFGPHMPPVEHASDERARPVQRARPFRLKATSPLPPHLRVERDGATFFPGGMGEDEAAEAADGLQQRHRQHGAGESRRRPSGARNPASSGRAAAMIVKREFGEPADRLGYDCRSTQARHASGNVGKEAFGSTRRLASFGRSSLRIGRGAPSPTLAGGSWRPYGTSDSGDDLIVKGALRVSHLSR